MGMSKKGIQESNFTFSKDRTSKFGTHKTRMPIIKCVCGFEILVVPDLKAINRAIRNHVANHKKASIGSERLTAFLTEQVLIVAAN
jgi:hypothetical protein